MALWSRAWMDSVSFREKKESVEFPKESELLAVKRDGTSNRGRSFLR